MSYEFNNLAREISEKLDAYQSNLQWLEADTKKRAEEIKQQAEYKSPQIELPTVESRLTPQEIKENFEKEGESYLNKTIAELDRKTSVKNPQFPIKPQQEKMLDLFRQNCSTDFVLSQFIK
ncbi:MAG: hypothetical protein ICV78_12375 [Tolypothrix sp. Co-bin9]|nr:hypothetical protein [Tolypothrix sp. Co-bin9]